MNRWFSARGACRGLTLSALSAALWLSWAVGFTQGSARVSPDATHATHTAHPSPSPACWQPVSRT